MFLKKETKYKYEIEPIIVDCIDGNSRKQNQFDWFVKTTIRKNHV